MPLQRYEKPYLSVAEQVEWLRAKGMEISDQERAEAILHRIGYYRLSGYSHLFRMREIRATQDGFTEEVLSEQFRPGTELSLVMSLYVFDKRLRLLLLDAIERIEVGLRVEVALILGKRGAFAYRHGNTFNSYLNGSAMPGDPTRHETLMTKLDSSLDRSREDFAVHFKDKYELPLPVWMSIELWDFGTLTTVLHGMSDGDLNTLVALYELPRRGLLTSWVQSLNYVRNICAHHGRLWNRALVQQPSPGRAGEVEGFDHLVYDEYAQRRLYAAVLVIRYLMRFFHPESSWSDRLREHIATFPRASFVNIRMMGFPDGWDHESLWSTQKA